MSTMTLKRFGEKMQHCYSSHYFFYSGKQLFLIKIFVTIKFIIAILQYML